MFDDLLIIIYRSIKLDKTLYSDPKIFSDLAIYFAGLIMILDGIAGATALNSITETLGFSTPKSHIFISGLTALITWLVWSVLIYFIGVKLIPDTNTNSNFRNVLIAVGIAHAPGLLRFFGVIPGLATIIVFATQILIIISLVIATRVILNYQDSLRISFFWFHLFTLKGVYGATFRAIGVILIAFLIITFISLIFIGSRLNSLPIN